ncbi:MAG: hypothetical protein N2652_11155 [Kiritimatiellae bacterium]|nr:hypothetical protein [Kiritimatiellia bacterium]
MLLSTTLRLFLDGLGRREEYEYYLRKFQTAPGTCFAAIVPDDTAVAEFLQAVEFDLQFLLKLELTPIVLLCGREAAAAARAMESAVPALMRWAPAAGEGWTRGTADRLAECRARRGGLILEMPARSRLEALLPMIPDLVRRVQWLRSRGMFRAVDGTPVTLHLLQGENDQELSADDAADEALCVASAALDRYPSLHFSVASPLDLLRELFTVRGRGTVIRRGSRILHACCLEGVDVHRLVAVLEEAFGRRLIRREWLAAVSDVYYEEQYRGAAVLERHPAGRYVSKFAVGMAARGEGLAQELWHRLRREHAALFWRSRADNPINGWYDQQAEGRLRGARWHIFWRGVRIEDIPRIVEYCYSRPPDFEEGGAGGA